MSTALAVAIGSIVWLLFWTVVFKYEEKTGERRFARGLRAGLDTAAARIAAFLARSLNWWGAGRVRLFIHFVVHRLLQLFLALVRWLEKGVESLLRQNRRHAKKINRSTKEENGSYLQEVAKHKQDISKRRK